jgi:hypothetical protein
LLGPLKPDLRIARALRKLDFHVPADEYAILVAARAAADEAAISLLVLDQLLWWPALSGQDARQQAHRPGLGHLGSDLYRQLTRTMNLPEAP